MWGCIRSLTAAISVSNMRFHSSHDYRLRKARVDLKHLIDSKLKTVISRPTTYPEHYRFETRAYQVAMLTYTLLEVACKQYKNHNI